MRHAPAWSQNPSAHCCARHAGQEDSCFQTLQPDSDGDIVAENIRAVQAIYFAYQLDSMRAFEVVDRLVELFRRGLLPLARGEAGRLLQRYYASTADRLSARQRQQLYTRALGVPGRRGRCRAGQP